MHTLPPDDDTIAFLILDEPVGVVVPCADSRAAVAAVLSGFPSVRGSSRPARYMVRKAGDMEWCVQTAGVTGDPCQSLASAVAALEWQVVSDALTSRPELFHLHGAALCAPSGESSVLVLGESGSGKTTLALALMARGFLPFADDVILLDADRLTPRTFGRAFHVDEKTLRLAGPRAAALPWRTEGLPDGHIIPGRWADRQAPVRAVFFPKRYPDGAPSATRLSPANGAAMVLHFSTTLDSAPRVAMRVAARLAERASCYALRAAALDDTADLVVRLVMLDANPDSTVAVPHR